MSAKSYTLDMARAIATVGAGIGAGVILSMPLISFPALRAVKKFTAQDHLRMWSKIYDFGSVRAPAILVPSSALFFLSAYLSTPFQTFPTVPAAIRFIAGNRRAILVACGVTLLSIMPYTGFLMGSTIKSLKQREYMADSEPEVAMQDTPKVINKWVMLNTGRGALATLAFVGGVLELLAC